MEEKPKMNQDNQNQKEKKKMPVALKRVLAGAACLTVLLGGGNLYATSQGYDNIFFLIGEKLGISKDVFGKEEILSDRDITISYRPIEISEGTLIQINSLVIKDNEAKLKIHVDEKNAKKIITPLTYKVKDENDVELCNYTSAHSQTHTDFKEELVLNNYKNDTKKLILEIYDLNMKKIVELEIDLEKKEINIIGNQEEVTKISEEELKKYLGAFAMLNYNGTEYNREMTVNEKKTITALLIAENNGVNVDAGLYAKNNTDVKRVLDKEKIHAFIESFTDLELNQNGVMYFNLNSMFYTQTYKGQLQYIYELDEIGCDPTVIEVTDIAYVGGIYNVTFEFCYSTEENKGFGTENTVEDLPIYEMSVGLILDEDNDYSKYRVSTMSEATLVEKETEDKDDIDLSDLVINNTHKNTIQSFFNIICAHEANTVGMLQIKEIGLIKDYEEWSRICNTNERDVEGYVKTNIKYSDYKEAMLDYVSESLFIKEFKSLYKEKDGYLYYFNGGGTGRQFAVEDVFLKDGQYIATIYNVTFEEETGSKGEAQYRQFNVEMHNQKYVISYCD